MSAALLLWAALAAASPVELSAAVRAQLVDAPLIRGAFVQEKRVKGFKRPLVSRGDFVVAKGRGVRWHTHSPFDSVLLVRKDDISSRQGDTEVFRLDAAKEPTVRVVNTVLFSLLAGDLKVLEQHFEVKGEVGASGWTLELVPKSEGLKKVLRRIAMTGDRFVRRLELSEASGDVTVIRIESPELAGPDAGADQAW
jgi:outer membrane lipoprotein-sorting protein